MPTYSFRTGFLHERVKPRLESAWQPRTSSALAPLVRSLFRLRGTGSLKGSHGPELRSTSGQVQRKAIDALDADEARRLISDVTYRRAVRGLPTILGPGLD